MILQIINVSLSDRKMKVVGLISGGKDSCFNILRCFEEGHDVVCLANLFPPPDGNPELDSFMYQSVGSEGIEKIAAALELPLFRQEINGKPRSIDFDYIYDEQDEVEDLYKLLVKVKQWDPEIQGVSAGAINSKYQKKRVEDVCQRLGMTPLCYLWEMDQLELLDAMISAGIEAILIKVAALGLGPEHLGMNLQQMRSHLIKMNAKYGLHICGEGGEFETFVLDCRRFRKAIRLDNSRPMLHSDNPISPVAYLKLEKLTLVEKPTNE